jgi:hypothetical protein
LKELEEKHKNNPSSDEAKWDISRAELFYIKDVCGSDEYRAKF